MYQLLKQIAKTGIVTEPAPLPDAALRALEQRIAQVILAQFGRALAIRHVDAGSCNGCELEIHAMNSPYYNLEGLGIKFVASPRHADMLLVTGPVSRDRKSTRLNSSHSQISYAVFCLKKKKQKKLELGKSD